MKKIFALPIVILGICFSGCLKDTLYKKQTYFFYTPVYENKDIVKANIKSNNARGVQNPGKIYFHGKYIFLNEIDKGIHIIDNSSPTSPKNIAFIDIPGNMDIAVKGNILYADLFSDLVTIDITDPLNALVKKYTNNIFPFRNYGNSSVYDSTKVIIDWIKKDTVIAQGSSDDWWQKNNGGGFAMQNFGGGNSPVGMGGSMARFAILNDRLYTVSTSELNVFNIGTPTEPTHTKKINIGWGIETIFPFKNNLFIGSQNGMFIYGITNPDNPVRAGQFAHATSCDPVVADDNYAFVTLRSGTTCQTFNNQLDVLQLNNLSNVRLLKTYGFTNPHGLSKDGNLLFICDGKDGLKIFDASDVMNLKLIKNIRGMETYDVIAYKNVALVVAKDGLYQFDYTKPAKITLLSKIEIIK